MLLFVYISACILFSYDHLQIRIPNKKLNGGLCASVEPRCFEISFMWLDLRDDRIKPYLHPDLRKSLGPTAFIEGWHLTPQINISQRFLTFFAGNVDLKMYKHWGVKADSLLSFKEIFGEAPSGVWMPVWSIPHFLTLCHLCKSALLYFGPTNNTTMRHIVHCVKQRCSSRSFGFNWHFGEDV
jgi:hypothetical protein